jgi:hypothetical protein
LWSLPGFSGLRSGFPRGRLLNRNSKGARGAVPALLKCLDDPDAKVQQNAAVSLREIAEQPEKAVPAHPLFFGLHG